MELRSLLQVVTSRWWLVIPAFVIAVGVTAVLTYNQRPIYQSTARLVVAPAIDLQDDALAAFALIARQSEITETYAQISSSRTIRDTAAQALGLGEGQRASLDLSSRLVPGTMLVEIDGSSPDAALAAAYANAASNALVDYVAENYGIFKVTVLDPATTPNRPVSPNIPLNLALGGIGGLLLGVGLALALHLLHPPVRVGLRDVVDPETWAFNDSFFRYRLGQEVSRSQRSKRAASVALLDINHGGALDQLLPRARTHAMRRVATLLDAHVRPEDLVARMEGTVFGILLPDTTEEQAVAMIESLRGRITAPALGTFHDGSPAHANPAAGVAAYKAGAPDVIEHAQSALRAAKEGPIGRTEAFSALRVQPST
jgi:diguanylate cyclase (GGDEF)-like protein